MKRNFIVSAFSLLLLVTLIVASDLSTLNDLQNYLRRNLALTKDASSNHPTKPKSSKSGSKNPTGTKKSGTPTKKKAVELGDPSERLPTVFILGVQKGGSSSMMWMLIMHPQLCSGERKEVSA